MRRIIVLVTVMLAALMLIPSTVALADQSYHTERLSLSVTEDGLAAGHTLRNGMVVNIHPNGPVNGAIEQYVLNGAMPDTDYEVCWKIVGMENELPTMVVHTDKNGNGRLTYKISREYQVNNGFVGFDGEVKWLFKAGDMTAFETNWTHVVVD